MSEANNAKVLRKLADLYDEYDSEEIEGKDFDVWCDKYDKAFMKVLDVIVEECRQSEFFGNLLKRIASKVGGLHKNNRLL